MQFKALGKYSKRRQSRGKIRKTEKKKGRTGVHTSRLLKNKLDIDLKISGKYGFRLDAISEKKNGCILLFMVEVRQKRRESLRILNCELVIDECYISIRVHFISRVRTKIRALKAGIFSILRTQDNLE